MLKSRDQAMSAGEKQRNQAEANTNWTSEIRQCQQGRRGATKQRHSHPGEQRPGNVSRGETEQLSRGTPILESRDQVMSAGEKQSNQAEALTCWKEETRQCQEGRTKQHSRGTYQLKSRKHALSAEDKCSSQGKVLTG